MGYDFAPGALAGALALEEAGEHAARVDVGYYALGGGPTSLSSGTRESVVGITLNDNHAFREGRVRSVRSAERVRSFQVAGKAREAISLGGAEHYGLPAVYPGLREVNVYLGWFGPLARPLQAGSFFGQFVLKVPGTRRAMRLAGEKTLGLLGGPEAGTTPDVRSWVAAEAYDSAGRQLSEVHLAGVDGYEFTRGFMAWAAQQPVSGTGALGPVEAYGLERLEAGAREAGLEARALGSGGATAPLSGGWRLRRPNGVAVPTVPPGTVGRHEFDALVDPAHRVAAPARRARRDACRR